MANNSAFALLAEFDTPEAVMHACAKVRDHGFEKWDAHVPFPVHGLEQAMGLKRSRVPLYMLVLGLTGAAVGMAMQWYLSIYGYGLVISGKPLFSWPAFVPIMFECGVLGGASGAIGGFLFESGLPCHHHGLFNSERFERSTDDTFFISIEAEDPKFDAERTSELLSSFGALQVELILA